MKAYLIHQDQKSGLFVNNNKKSRKHGIKNASETIRIFYFLNFLKIFPLDDKDF